MEEGRNPFWQGLLQVAVGLYHHENDNLSGAIKLLTQSLDKLGDKRDVACGADIALLYQQTESYLRRLQEEGNFPFEPFEMKITDDKLHQLALQFVPHVEE
jgi:predicted metal-dependent hydrolase